MGLFNMLKKKKEQKQKRKDAIKKIDLALASNRLWAFMAGISIYKLEISSCGMFNSGYNVTAIMEALYVYCKNVRNIEDEIQTALDFLANSKSFDSARVVLEITEYQLNAEKIQTAPFKLNIEKTLLVLKNNIKSNEAFFHSSGEMDGYVLKNGMMDFFLYYDKKLNNDYGYRILS